MAYVRQHGNQLEIVHGQRDPETGDVRQKVLFTLYSRPEALAALSEEEGGQARVFRSLLESAHPDIRFNWKRIWWAIARKVDLLPPEFKYQAANLLASFRQDLVATTRQLILADPQWLASAAEVVRNHRFELEYMRELIAWRLQLCDAPPSKWTEDNQFFWRFRLKGNQINNGYYLQLKL